MMKKLFILLLVVCSTIASSLANSSVRLSISPARGKNHIEKGDIFYMSINVTNCSETPSKPSLQGAKLMYFDRTSSSSSYSSINGAVTQSYSATYTATFKAMDEGSFSYGPISVGGVKSNKVNYSIGPAAATPSATPVPSNSPASQSDNDADKPKFIGKGDDNLFLRASVSSSTAYEQQALVYTVKLYTTYDAVKFVGATAAPKFDGFVIEESKDISNSLTLETYNGKTYATAVIARYIIFPQMVGNLKVAGNTYTVAVDRREYFHDAFWGNMSFSTPMQLSVSPNDLVVNVKSLPTPKPADFSGAVGKFSISSQLKSSNFKSNQAAAIVYKVEGTGNIKYVQMPDLSALYPPEIEIYTPKATQNVAVKGSNVTGSVSFDYSFMPLEEGELKIPEVKLVYFDPETGKYESSVAKGYTISVGKGAASSKSNSARIARFNSDLQNVNVDKLKKQHNPYVYSFSYWLWYIIPVVLLAATLIGYRRYVSSHADMAAFNSRRANKIARKRLRKAAAAAKRNDADSFYNELLVALWGYLGDKLKMPTSELLRDNVRQVLSERGVPEISIDEFIRMIDDAEFAKYSSAGGKENLSKDYDRAAELINRLEKDFKS